MSNYQQKYKSGDQLFRMELEKSKEESSKLKLDYDSECLRVSQLT